MLEEREIIEIYREFKKELLIYIYRFTRSHETSEDIFHDCFINLINYSKNNEVNRKTLRAFLYKTAHNLSINYIKKSKRIKFTSLDESGDPPSRDSTVSNMEREDLENEISNILNNVDELSRSIFIMRKELNLNLSEIAQNTGKSERTIRRKLIKVVDFLTAELKKTGFLTFILFLMSILVTIFVPHGRGRKN